MKTITRRAALASIPAMGTAAIVPAVAAPVKAEHPWEAARRLGKELAAVLAQDIGDGIGPGGEWYAEIHPAGRECNVMFGSIDAREWPRRNVSLTWQNLVAAHKEAWEAFGRSVTECDVVGREPSKAAQRRWNRTNRAEEKALEAICAFHPHGAADAKAKAAFIAPFIQRGELTPEQIMALNYAGVRS